MTNPYDVDPDTPGLRPADRVRLARLDGLPASFVAKLAESYGLCPDGTPLCSQPKRRRVVLANPTAAERRFLAEGPPPPPTTPVAARRVTLAAVRQRRPDLADALVASGLRTRPVDPRRRPTWNGGHTFHDLVANGGRLP
ncbi:MAG TPA: hypothetical protein VK611_17055 [Acidimicrobiales bacterium]|nr:hypothetical protein [Acidimicrobiales bacterium]